MLHHILVIVKNLEILDVSCCQIKELPETLSYMFRLYELNLGSNQLTQLPETIGMLTRLAALNASDNHLDTLPVSMGFIFGLEKVDLNNNCFEDPAINLKLKNGVNHLLDWLEKRMNASFPEGVIDDRDYLNYLARSRPELPALPALEGVSDAPNKGSGSHGGSGVGPRGSSPYDQRNIDTSGSGSGIGSGGSGFNGGGVGSPAAAGRGAMPNPKDDPEVQAKVYKLREIASNLVKTIQSTLLNYKRELSSLSSVEQGIPLAKLAVSLKSEIEKMHADVSGYTVGLKIAPPRTEGEDKLLVLKRTVAISFDNLTTVVHGLSLGISKTDDLQKLVFWVTGLKNVYGLVCGDRK